MAAHNSKLSANMEDYLEVIAILKDDKGVARVKDISDRMNVKKPSVTAAMNLLASRGLIEHERYGYIDLSTKGEKVARDIKGRHDLLTKFFVDILGVPITLAESEACKIEHSLSNKTTEKLTRLIEYIEMKGVGKKPIWLKKLDAYIKEKKPARKRKTMRG